MKKICIKILACVLIALCTMTTVSMYVPVNAAGASTLTYESYNFSFKSACTLSANCTGIFLDIKINGTAANNNNETVTLKVHVVSTGKTKTYTFLTDGKDHTFKGIYLGLSGGSNVGFEFIAANPEINLNLHMEIGS